MFRLFSLLMFRLLGWRIEDQRPKDLDRYIVVVAPHTSNWDFPLTLAMARVSGVKIRWLGKDALFRGPMGPVMRYLGGVSIDRSAPQGTVAVLAKAFTEQDDLVLVVPAEGTRSKGDYWKSGFYRIAEAAGVPIVCAFVDSATRSGGFGPVFRPTGDVGRDMDLVRAFYAGKVGLKAGGTTAPRLREEDEPTAE